MGNRPLRTNFEFLKFKKEFNVFSDSCIEAEKSILVSTVTTAILNGTYIPINNRIKG